MKNLKNFGKLFVFIFILFLSICKSEEKFTIFNPYENVNWKSFNHYKACLHAHTTMSDGFLHPHQVVDRYRALGYRILSITDHNKVVYPWVKFSELAPPQFKSNKFFLKGIKYKNRIPKLLGMVAIMGCELSNHHHTGNYFNDFNGEKSVNIEDSLAVINEKNGLAVLFHPAGYKEYNDDWYINLFKKYHFLVGIEVYNSHNCSSEDLWDRLLTQLMPDRPIWGFSNDDSHLGTQIGINWNVFLLSKLNVFEVKKSMQNGNFYFGYSPDKPAGIPVMIKKIEVDKERGIIRIYASNYTKIEWISNGNVIYTGDEIILEKVEDKIGNYIRARIYGIDGKTITQIQPFGILRQK